MRRHEVARAAEWILSGHQSNERMNAPAGEEVPDRAFERRLPLGVAGLLE